MYYYAIRDRCDDNAIVAIYSDGEDHLGWGRLHMIDRTEFDTLKEFGIEQIRIDDTKGYDWKTRNRLIFGY